MVRLSPHIPAMLSQQGYISCEPDLEGDETSPLHVALQACPAKVGIIAFNCRLGLGLAGGGGFPIGLSCGGWCQELCAEDLESLQAAACMRVVTGSDWNFKSSMCHAK